MNQDAPLKVQLEVIKSWDKSVKQVQVEIIPSLTDIIHLEKEILKKVKIAVKNFQFLQFHIKTSHMGSVPSASNLPLMHVKDLLFYASLNTFIGIKTPIQIILSKIGQDQYQPFLLKYTISNIMRNQQYIYNFDGFDPIFELNNPKSDPLYVGTIQVYCAFCKKSSEEINILGPLYGPFKKKKKKKCKTFDEYYVHLMCALWSDSVFISESDHLMNVDREIDKSMTQKCLICKDIGASLKCHEKNCQVLYHCRCFLLDYERFLSEIPIHQPKFYFYCQKHAKLAEKDHNFKEDIEWIELICKICKLQDCDILCDKCDNAYHLRCLDLDDEPNDEDLWFCRNCQNYKNASKRKIIRIIEDD